MGNSGDNIGLLTDIVLTTLELLYRVYLSIILSTRALGAKTSGNAHDYIG